MSQSTPSSRSLRTREDMPKGGWFAALLHVRWRALIAVLVTAGLMVLGFASPAQANITGITPSTGSIAGGTSVTITADFSGTSFGSTQGTGYVQFGTSSYKCTNYTWASRSITCTTPAHAAGAVTVTVIRDGGGAASGSTTFTYATIAPTVTTTAATSIGTTSATMNATVNANGTSTATSFCYDTASFLASACPSTVVATPTPVTGSSDTSISATLTGLVSGQIYYFRAKGVSSAGTTESSTILNFTTSVTRTLTYSNNGGTGTLVDPSSPYSSGATVTVLANPGTITKTGAAFVGWNTAANGSGTNYLAGDTFTIGATTTLYARWLTPMSCVPAFYQISGGKLYTYDAVNNTYNQVGSATTTNLNSIGRNPKDGLIYGLVDQTLWVIDDAGTMVNLGSLPDLAAVSYYSADFIADDVMLVAPLSGNSNWFTVNVTNRLTTPFAVSGVSYSATDFAANADKSFVYAINSAGTTLYKVPVTAPHTIATATVTGVPAAGTYYASAWMDATGALTVASTTAMYVVKGVTGTPTGTLVTNSVASGSGQDGASCPAASSPFMATATANAATSVTGAGATLNGTVNAKNGSTTVTFEYSKDSTFATGVTSVAATPGTVTGTTDTSVTKAITGLDAATTYYFRVVAVNRGGTTTSTNQSFTTGAAASRLVITGSGTMTAGGSNSLTITAKDAGGATVTSYTGDKQLTFSGAASSTSPVTAPTVSSKTGVATAFGTAMTVTFTNGVATVSGVNNGVMKLYKAETALISVTDGTLSSAGADRLSVVVSAATVSAIAVSAGNNQTAAVSTAVATAPAAVASDAYGNPVSSVTITFAVTAGAGVVAPLTVSTDASGIATLTSWTLGAVAGSNTMTATLPGPGASVTFTATGTVGGATRLVITGSGTMTAGVGQNLTITAKDAGGNTVAAYTGSKNLTFSGAASSASPVTTPKVTDRVGTATAFGTATPINFTNGVATASGSSNGVMILFKAETALIAATDGTITSTGADRLSVVVSAASASHINVSAGDGQSATVNTAVTTNHAAVATDDYGNPVSGVTITFAVTGGGGVVAPLTVTTDANGVATVTSWTLGASPGANSMTATLPGDGAPHATFGATATTGPASGLAIHAGGAQTAPVSTSVGTPPSVIVTDGSGNPVAGVDITFTVASGGGRIARVPTIESILEKPGKPAKPEAVPGDSSGEVTITVAPGTGGVPATYTVTSTPDDATCTVPVGTLSCTVEDLTVGTEYTFTATATNTSGTSEASEPSDAVKPADSGKETPGVPGTPGAPSAEAGLESATVTVTPGEGGTADTFTVMSDPDGLTCEVPVGSLSCTVSGLTGGVSYTFTAKANSSDGTSAWSAPSNAVVPTAAPLPLPDVVPPADPVVVVDDPANSPADVPLEPAAGSVNKKPGKAPSRATTLGGSPTEVTVRTGADGIASLGSWTLGGSAGLNTLSAAADGLGSVTFTATGTATPAPAPEPGPGPAPAPDPTATPIPSPAPASSPPPAPVPEPSGQLPELLPDQSLLMINGVPTPVTIVPNETSTGLVVTGDGFQMLFVALQDDGNPAPLGSDLALRLRPGGFARVTGTGFLAGSPVYVWLFSDPLLASTIIVGGDGTFDSNVRVPDGLEAGDHTLQANGTTVSNAQRSMSLGVVVGKQMASRNRVYFDYMSTHLTKEGKKALRAMVKKLPSKAAQVTIINGVVRAEGAKPSDMARAKARAKVIKAYLRSVGLHGPVEIRNTARTNDHTAVARRAQVLMVFVD